MIAQTVPQVAPTTPQPQQPIVMQDGTQLDPGVVKVMKTIKTLETGGSQNPYAQVGDNGTSFGAYQWNNGKQPIAPGQTPVNWQNDAQTYLGNSHAPMTPGNQNQVAYSKMLQWKHEGYQPSEIDAMWNGAHKDEASGMMVHNNIVRQNQFNQLLAQQVTSQTPDQGGSSLFGTTAYASDGADSPKKPQGGPSVYGFIGNAAQDTGSVLGALGQAITHPITTAQNILSAAGGGIEKLFGAAPNVDTQNFDKIWKVYADKYGGHSVGQVLGNIAHTFYTHPISTALDFSTLLDGFGGVAGGVAKMAGETTLDAAKIAEITKATDFISSASGIMKSGSPEAIEALSTPGAITHIAEAIKTLADYTNPINLVAKGVGLAAKGALRVGEEAAGVSTGAGFGAMKGAFQAGTEGGDAQAALRAGMKGGEEGMNNVIQSAQDAFQTVKEEQRALYQTQLAKISDASHTLTSGSLAPIFTQFDNLLSKFKVGIGADGALDFSNSLLRHENASMGDITDIKNALDAYKSGTTKINPVTLDDLKQTIDGMYSPGTRGSAFTSSMKTTVRDVLNKNVPEYQKMTSAYAKSQTDLNEFKSALSVGGKASGDTIIRKLTSTIRGNNEYRKALLAKLEATGGENIASGASGVALQSWLPIGLSKYAESISALLNPHLLMALPFTSPRLMGEFFLALGKGNRALTTIGNAFVKYGGETALKVGTQVNQASK